MNTAIATTEPPVTDIYHLSPKEVMEKITDLLVERTNRDYKECYNAVARSVTEEKFAHYTHAFYYAKDSEEKKYHLKGFRQVLEDAPCAGDYYFGCACGAQPLKKCPHCGAYMTLQLHINKETGRLHWVEPRAAICQKYQDKKKEEIAKKYGQPTQTQDDLTVEVKSFYD